MTSIDKKLLWITRIGVFCVPFIPLIVSGYLFFPFITGKGFAFRIVSEIIFATWILLALRVPRFRTRQSCLLWTLIAFLFIILIADISGVNPFKSFWSNYERMEGFITLIHLFAYFLVVSSVFDTEKWWNRFFATSVGVSAFLGVYGILQIAGKIVINQGGARLDGTLGNAAYFAGYMLFHIFLTAFLIFRHKGPNFVKWLYGAAIALQIFTLYFTATRGAFVGLVVGLLLSLSMILILEKENKKMRKYSAIFLVVLIAIVSVLFLFKNSPFIKENPVLTRFASISVTEAGPRFMVWGMALNGFKEHPILGWGQENFNFVFNKYYNPKMWAQEQWFDRTHNIFFDWLIAGGLLGLLSYLALFVVLVYYIWRKKNENAFSVFEKSVLTGLLVGYFTHNFFVFDNLVSYILFFSLLAFMHYRESALKNSLFGDKAVLDGNNYYIGASIVVVFLAGFIYFVNVKNIFVAKDLIDALKAQTGGVAENLKIYERALKRGSFARQEITEQLSQLSASVVGNAGVPQGVKNNFVVSTVKAFDELISRVPDDARHRVFAGSFLNRLGRFEEAIVQLEKAHELSPKKQGIVFELSSSYLNSGRGEDALVLLKEALESDPEFSKARLVYSAVAVYMKKYKLAEELQAPIYETAVFDDLIVRAYFDMKKYDKVLEIWKERVKKKPTNPQFRISLASAFLLNERRSESIAALEEAKKLNPAIGEEIDSYISEIRAGRNP